MVSLVDFEFTLHYFVLDLLHLLTYVHFLFL